MKQQYGALVTGVALNNSTHFFLHFKSQIYMASLCWRQPRLNAKQSRHRHPPADSFQLFCPASSWVSYQYLALFFFFVTFS